MENIGEVSNIYQLLAVLAVILLGSGGALWKVFELKNTRLERQKIADKIEVGLSEIDNKQNERIEKIESKLNISEQLLKNANDFLSKNTDKTVLEDEINEYVQNFMLKVSNSEMEILLTNGVELGISVFNWIYDRGLKTCNIDTLKTRMSAKFKQLRAGISISKMGVGTEFKEIVKKEIIIPNINNYIINYRAIQKGLKNGDLKREFNEISKNLIVCIIEQTYERYKDVKRA